jgi:hypothetical protein
MSSHEQVELRTPGLRGVENWVVKLSTAGSVGSHIKESARKLNLTTIFARSIEERPIVGGNLFRHLLSLERKRSERCGSSFMLAVLGIEDMLRAQDERKVLAPLQRGIFSAIRSTDLVGWYEENQLALGILFTGIAEPNQVVASAILKRLKEAISAHTNPALVRKMGVTCHAFLGGETKGSRSLAERRCVAGD